MFLTADIVSKLPYGAGQEFNFPPGNYTVDLDELSDLDKHFNNKLLSFTQPTKSHVELEAETNRKIFLLYMALRDLAPMTSVGDLIYGNSVGKPQRLAGNSTTTRKFLRQVGTGAVPNNPAWDTLAAGDLGTGTANSSVYLAGDLAWRNPLSINQPVAGGGVNRVLHENGSQNLSVSDKFLFDGNDLRLVNPTAATAGAQQQNSPYLEMAGAQWNGIVSQLVGARLRAKPNFPSSVSTAQLAVEFLRGDGSGWQESLIYRNKTTDYLTIQLVMGSPAVAGHGGMLEVSYDGFFGFKKLNGDVAGLNAPLIAGQSVGAFPTFSEQPGTYTPTLRAYFDSHIRFTAGNPGSWAGPYSDGQFASGNEWVRSDLPVGVGLTAAPTAALEIRRTTTPQSRTAYSATAYKDESVSSAGVVTHDIVGSSAENIWPDPGTFDSTLKRKSGASTQYAQVPGTIAVFLDDVDSTGAGLIDAYVKSLAASIFDVNGHRVEASYYGTGNNTDFRYLQVEYAGTVIWDSGKLTPTANADDWEIHVTIIRQTSSAVKYRVSTNFLATELAGDTPVKVGTLGSLTFTNAHDLKLKLDSDSAGDITAKFGKIDWHPAA